MTKPLIILAPGRCFSSVVCAMLGQNPQAYDFLETQIFVRDTMEEWWNDFSENVYSQGLLRSAAEILFGQQSGQAINLSRRWLWKRRGCSTREVFAELAERIYPLMGVEKSPMVTYRKEHMERARTFFPSAKFLHLVRNPIGYGQSLINFFRDRAPLRHPFRLAKILRNPESIFFGLFNDKAISATPDPQTAWYVRQSEVLAFTSTLPKSQCMRVRGEDLLSCPRPCLTSITRWLGISSDPDAIEAMEHPERSPFAQIGPWNARFGADPKFLANPILRRSKALNESLDTPVPWGDGSGGLRNEVKRLARELGYR